jgi:hypothetical protein
MGQRVVRIPCLGAVIVFVFSTGSSAAAQDKKDPKPKVEQAIGIWTPPFESWLLIFSDGSGRLGYGDGGTPDTDRSIRAGTFDVVQVTKDLRGLKADIKDWQKARYGFNFESERKCPEEPGPTYYTQDQKVILSLFEKAAKASGRK